MESSLSFGQWLKRRRQGLGLTQRALGQQAGNGWADFAGQPLGALIDRRAVHPAVFDGDPAALDIEDAAGDAG